MNNKKELPIPNESFLGVQCLEISKIAKKADQSENSFLNLLNPSSGDKKAGNTTLEADAIIFAEAKKRNSPPMKTPYFAQEL